MASLPIHWILVRAYVHATEEEERVVQAMDTACPAGEIRRDVLQGEHGNSIVHLLRKVSDGRSIASVWQTWDKVGLIDALRPHLEERLDDDGVLHFRCGKQAAFEGSVTLALGSEGDTLDIQVKLKAFPAKPEEIRKVARGLVAEAA